MNQESTNQYSIARDALQRLFSGRVALEETKDGFFQIRVAGDLQLQALEDCLGYLTKQTGLNKAIDPFKEADGTAWVILSQLLSRVGLRTAALQIASSYVELCYKLQIETKIRIHKGAPLFWMAERLHEMGDVAGAIGFMLLAYVEDIKFYDEPRRAPAYQRLVGVLGVSPIMLDSLTRYGKGLTSDFPHFPEEILIKWELANLPSPPRLKRKRS